MTVSKNSHDDDGMAQRRLSDEAGRDPWKTPTMRVLAAAATENGLPDDITERPSYETKPS